MMVTAIFKFDNSSCRHDLYFLEYLYLLSYNRTFEGSFSDFSRFYPHADLNMSDSPPSGCYGFCSSFGQVVER